MALVLRDELDAGAGAARHLAPPAGLELDVVHERAGGDVLERQRIPGTDVGGRARLDDGADTQPRRSEDVALRAVGVVEQRDPRRAVRVVLDRGDLRGHAVLLALEVDDAVAPLVATALVPHRQAPVVVAAALLRQLLGERLLGLRLRDVVERRDRHEAAARRRRLELANRHYSCAPSKIGIVSPWRTCTMAFFQPGRVPLISPRRFGFACTLRMFTRSTCTSNSCSTACRTCRRCASGWILNAYLRSSMRL